MNLVSPRQPTNSRAREKALLKAFDWWVSSIVRKSSPFLQISHSHVSHKVKQRKRPATMSTSIFLYFFFRSISSRLRFTHLHILTQLGTEEFQFEHKTRKSNDKYENIFQIKPTNHWLIIG